LGDEGGVRPSSQRNRSNLGYGGRKIKKGSVGGTTLTDQIFRGSRGQNAIEGDSRGGIGPARKDRIVGGEGEDWSGG